MDFEKITAQPQFYAQSITLAEDPAAGVCVTQERPGVPLAKAGATPKLHVIAGEASAIDAQYASARFLNYHPGSGKDEKYRQEWSPEAAALPTDPGTYEISIAPCAAASGSEMNGAQRLWQESLDAAVRNGWFDYDKAKADGFHLGHPQEEVHYVHTDFVGDDDVLNPDKPEFLMYYDYEGTPLLAGYMYMMPNVEDRGPQVGGPHTLWHYHVMPEFCYRDGLVVGAPNDDGTCTKGDLTTRTPEMLHVWFFERDDGPFASSMSPATASGTKGDQFKSVEHHH